MKLLILGTVSLLLLGLGYWLWTPDKPLAVLKARYLEAPEDMITVLGTRLHVRDRGPQDAPAVIMIHGFGSSLHTWSEWSQQLSSDFRVISFDLPGSGLSAPDAEGDYTDARSLAILSALMQHLGITRADLIGNSIGGRIAWRFAAAHPDKVRRLVLVSPDGFASPGYDYGKAAEVPAIAGVMRYVLPKFMLRMNLAPAYADPNRLSPETVTRYYDLMLGPGTRQAVIDRMKQTVLVPPAPRLRKIDAPVLLLWGEKDAMIPISNAADYQQALSNVSLARLPNLGHTPQEEDPDRSLAPVREFLSR